MDLKIEINLDNDVFAECPNDEICLLLQRIGRQFTCADIPKDMDGKTIKDTNGNTIGKIKITN